MSDSGVEWHDVHIVCALQQCNESYQYDKTTEEELTLAWRDSVHAKWGVTSPSYDKLPFSDKS